ncbi:hypothetical protein SEVIR_7G223001v4 [Setaria viridis]
MATPRSVAAAAMAVAIATTIRPTACDLRPMAGHLHPTRHRYPAASQYFSGHGEMAISSPAGNTMPIIFRLQVPLCVLPSKRTATGSTTDFASQMKIELILQVVLLYSAKWKYVLDAG